MCYHYDASGNKKAMKRLTFITETEEYKPVENANGFAHPAMPVVTNLESHKIQLFQWGLIPQWVELSRAHEMQNSTLNARAETLFELASYKDCVQQRCLVLADSFYEWRTEGKKKIPYQIFLKENESFSMGGIFSVWKNPRTGQNHHSFSIVTVPANDMMEYIHNIKKRMPLILNAEAEQAWLKGNLTNSAMNLLMKPYKSSEMKAVQIKHEGDQYSLF